jgi:hypothetical protein
MSLRLRSPRAKLALSLAAIFAAFAFSAYVRLSLHTPTMNYRDFDATWHVLLTLRAMSENDFSAYLGLPIVTLGGDENKFYPWGGTLETAAGNHLYASFPPLGFFFPYLALKAVGAEIDLDSLIRFNLLIHLCAAIGVFLLAKTVLTHIKAAYVYVGAALLAICYLFTTETLYSHGAVYWAHSLFQLVYIYYLCLIALTLRNQVTPRVAVAANFVFCTVLASIDWTGYLVAFTSGLVLYLTVEGTTTHKRLLLVSAWGGLIVALAYMLTAYSALVPPSAYHQTLLTRMEQRGLAAIVALDMKYLIGGYFSSFSGIVFLLGGLFLLRGRRSDKLLRVMTIIAGVAMLENIIMFQHAIEYTYDRLKLFQLLTVGYVLLWQRSRLTRTGAIILCALTMFLAITRYQVSPTPPASRFDYDNYAAIRMWDVSEQLARNAPIRRGLPTENVVIGVPTPVRGYINLDWGRSIYETVTPSLLIALAEARHADRWIYLFVYNTGSEMYRYDALVYSDHGDLTLRYVDLQSPFAFLDCAPLEPNGIVKACTEAQLRSGLVEPPLDVTDDELLNALAEIYGHEHGMF